ncbi:CPBP family intramembrane glutamic endopeptidase [Caldilinea sp.]|uniref:CPBP family intramembrane glutamic endopeptidase n=1 Tax=Caldilinea sp. TaxID=2293560 RepID=UPI002CCA84AF|nr:CPBP family intramembrane metalloprotease [Anaerolineales bacterium]HQY90435.1 CPBP family intramembrane metalloprotease [Caldilinea sp.]
MHYALFVIGTAALTALIGYSTVATAVLLRRWQPPGNPLLQRGDVVLRLALIGLCLGLGVLSQLSWATLGWTLPRPLRQLALGMGVGLGLGLSLYALSRGAQRLAGTRLYNAQFAALITPHSRAEFWLVLLALAPVVMLEELLFRSLLLGGLTPILPVYLLLIGGSILFGALHLPQGPVGMAGAGLASLVLGALFFYAHSLLAPLVAHYLTNLVQLILAMQVSRRASIN